LLTDIALALVPPEKAKFFESDELFGTEVATAFPSARQDIKDAGNCLALDLNTAAVFHLMRVMEVGVKAMARHLKVRIKAGLDYVTLGEMAKKIDAKLQSKTLKARGKKRTEALEF